MEQPGERRETEAEEGGELGERGGDGEAFGLWSETRAEPLEGLGVRVPGCAAHGPLSQAFVLIEIDADDSVSKVPGG